MNEQKMIVTAYDTMNAAIQMMKLPEPNKDKIIGLQLRAFQILSTLFIMHCTEQNSRIEKMAHTFDKLTRDIQASKNN
jgi:hypothetical protein